MQILISMSSFRSSKTTLFQTFQNELVPWHCPKMTKCFFFFSNIMDSQIFGVYQPAALIPFDAQIAPSLANQWRPLHTDPVSFFFFKGIPLFLLFIYF